MILACLMSGRALGGASSINFSKDSMASLYSPMSLRADPLPAHASEFFGFISKA